MVTSPPERVVIIGGSSGLGLGLARALLDSSTEVTIVGRSPDRLAAARRELTVGNRTGDLIHTVQADISREQDVARLFADIGTISHIVTTAADGTSATGPIERVTMRGARGFLDTKVIGPWLVAKYGAQHLTSGGSITFTSGIAAYRPTVSGAIVAAANGALESLAYALALELAPIRVNVVSPGWVDTPVWDTLAGVDRTAAFEAMAKRLPVGRIGTPVDLAHAYLSAIRNGFITGSVLHVDGGQRLV
ncbi:MAG: SDR family oxidoreductase [Frankia sp.]